MRFVTLFPSRFALVGLVAVSALVARAAESAVKFRPLTLEAASTVAAKEGKLVFIDFYTTWCAPCKQLDSVTWTDAAVGRLVNEKAVALKLDAEKEGLDAAKRYKIGAYPTLLLLKADGTEVDRIIGFREPALFKTEFNKLLVMAQTGRTGLEEARAQVAQNARPAAVETTGDAEDAQPHFDLARKLLTAGKHEEALKELVWCWDEGKKDPEFARTRSSTVTNELLRLSRDYPPAREVMVSRRDQARERALANKGGSVVVQDLIQLNKALKQDDDTIAVFDQMPEGDRRRSSISIYLFDNFVEKQRYRDAVFPTMFDSAAMIIERAKSPRSGMPASPAGYVVNSTVKRVEALAGVGQLDQAHELGQKLLAFDSSDETKALLRKHAARAGQPDLFAGVPLTSPKKD